ncbi:hypothetical protein Gotri_023141 [Gossypium trilobum]|uniref:Uncharacterized protein n=1 Tax=Gossypium trilobum TaxID=34281 RepID=A0A7J9DI51_9ROSI|nr:hypothetical protein [Gossypium trilobum]
MFLRSHTVKPTMLEIENKISYLNGDNYSKWKEDVILHFGCIELDCGFCKEMSIIPTEGISLTKISEPALVPKWLRTSGTTTEGVNFVPHFASSSSNTDASSLMHHGRHRNSRNISDFDFPCLAILDRSSSMNSWRSCSNGSAKHAYSTFRSILTSKVEKLGGILTSRDEIYRLWRSHSMIYGKQGEPLHQRTVVDSRDSGINNHYDGNGLLCGGTFGSSINKAVFEKDFPSLGTKEKQGVSEIARVSSPKLPSVDGSSGTGSLPASLIVSTSGSGSPSVTAGLNMVEALTQAPSRTHTIPRVTSSVSKFLLHI